MDSKKAAACVLAAGALWGTISLPIRALTAAGLSSPEIVCIRLIVSMAVLFFVILATDKSKLKIRLRDLWIFLGTGVVSVVLFNVCYFRCIQISEASVAVVLLYTSPIWVTLMGAAFFKERINAKKIGALVLCIVGCVAVTGVLGGFFKITPLAAVLGLASGFFYATYSIFGQVALKKYDTMTVTFYTFLFGAACSLFVGNPTHAFSVLASNHVALVWGLETSLLTTVAPYLLYTWGLSRMESGKAAILATVEPLVAACIGIFVYHESTGVLKITGMILILAAVIILNVKSKKEQAEEAA